MTKKELVKSISEEIGLSQLKTEKIVQSTFDAIINALSTEGRIELRNFGIFKVKKRAARKGRNPRTGNQIEVAEKYVVIFKPGKEMEAKVARLLKRNRERMASEKLLREKNTPPATGNYSLPKSDGPDSSVNRVRRTSDRVHESE